MTSARPGRRELVGAALWYGLLAAAVLHPVWRPGYFLLLDWTPTPEIPWRLDGALGVQQVPLLALLKALHVIVPTWVLQRLLLLGALWGAGMAAHVAAPVRTGAARFFAGTLYSVNPFTITRLLAGHWRLLLAYALVPLAARAVLSLAEAPSRRRGAVAGAWIAALAAISAHALLLGILLASAGAAAVACRVEARRVGRGFAVAAVVLAAGTLWWIVPAAAHGPPPGTADLEIFASRSSGGVPVPLSIVALRGFWIPRLEPAGPPAWPFLAAGLAGLALAGGLIAARDGRRIAALSLLFSAVVALVMATGVASPVTAPIARFLHGVPGFAAFREPHKAALLLALALAWLGAVAVGSLGAGRSRALRALAVAAVALPIVFSFPAFGGVGGRLQAVNYPASWEAADRMLQREPGRFSVLFLPWRLYLPLPFSDPAEPVANPASDFFSVPVVASKDPQLGPDSAKPADPVSRRIERLILRHRTVRGFGAAVAPLDIRYVLLLPGVPPGSYDFLFRQRDLQVVSFSPDLVVLRNTAWSR